MSDFMWRPDILLPAGAILSAILVYLLTGLATRRQWMGVEANARSNHVRTISRAGGIITLLLTLGIMIGGMVAGLTYPLYYILVLTAAGLGLADDVLTLKASSKLVIMIAIAISLAVVAGPIVGIPLPWGGSMDVPFFLGAAISVIFLVCFINMVNFMDGLNGMAGGTGIVGLGLLLFLSMQADALAPELILIAAALYGFTVRNVLKGGIFLGDCGSLALGALLSGGALFVGQSNPLAPYIVSVAFMPYILDTGATLLRRWRRGASILEAHKEHFYQLLRADGASHQAVSSLYTVLVLLNGVLAVLLAGLWGSTGVWLSAVIATALYIGVIVLAFRLAQARRTTDDSARSSSTSFNGESGKDDRAAAA